MRRLVIAAIAVCVVVPTLPARITFADDTAAEQAAREIADARDRANDAAAAIFAAEEDLADLATEQQVLEAEITQLEGQMVELREQVTQAALNRYTRSSGAGSPLLTGFDTPEEQMQIQALTEVMTDTSDEQFDDFDALNRDLAYQRKVLQRQRERTEAQQQRLAELRDTADAEIEHLKQVESQRLQDQAVRKAVEAEQRRRAEAAAAAAAKAAPASSASTAAGAGGTTGGGGGRPGVSRNWTGVDWLCPTGSANVGFSDTWHAARSGGRLHQGTDMIGASGTPLLAVVDGVAKPKTNELGGNTVGLLGADGNYYYYAHLDRWGTVGNVTKGTIIGYMGDTGNASGPHLHFEIHPGNGDAVNPYLTLLNHCPAPPQA